MADPKPPTIIAIDLVRFACALLVVWNHYALTMWLESDPRIALALRDIAAAPVPLAHAGLVGVELFFVISGMVIARSAVRTQWVDFLRRRLLRLAPAAWICATSTAFALAASGQADDTLVADWARSMRFWPIGAQIDGSYWTLGVECAFYLLVALLATGSARRVVLTGWGLAVASALFWVACLALGDRASAVITNQAAILLLLPHGCFFAVGIALANRATRGSGVLLTLALATGTVEIAAHVGGWRIGAATVVAEAIFAGGIAVLAAARALQPWLARRIDLGRARTLGLMTYPLYLLHQTAGGVLIGALARSGVPRDAAVALTLVTMLAAAWLIAAHAEPALRGALARLVSPRRAPAPDSLRSASPPTG